jgi:hypothetical protein
MPSDDGYPNGTHHAPTPLSLTRSFSILDLLGRFLGKDRRRYAPAFFSIKRLRSAFRRV